MEAAAAAAAAGTNPRGIQRERQRERRAGRKGVGRVFAEEAEVETTQAEIVTTK